MMANLGEAATQEPKCPYDIFISFRGEDTRHSFTGFLYDALRRKGFNIFLDDVGLQGGDQIAPSLVKAIQQSRISIVVFSQKYATSPWCLDELVNILHCMKSNNQLVWPIFYKVDPSDVRHQLNSYAEAMAKHENRFGKDSQKVQKWRSTLFQVANLKGWHFKTGYEYEYEFIQRIAELATTKLHREQLFVGEHIIGHQSCIKAMKSLLDIESRNTICMVGIHGTGGIGKTTLAKAVYNLIADQFECATFLEGVRQRSDSYMGLVHLQEAILSKMYEGENIKLGNVGEGAARLKDRLCHRRVLLVLDDVDSEDQLEKLAGECNWFGSGSRIIITTRDKHVLNVHGVEKRYEMRELNDQEALQLFCWKAFNMSQPATNYEDVSNRAVRYANGLPLALKVIGSNLVGKSVMECESALEQYEKVQDKKIHDILKISYDCLPENAQYIFLDIACFFKGNRREIVEEVLERCGFSPTYNIRILVEKSLLTVQDDCLRMHDLIQDMGKEVARLDAPRKPSERRRLCFHEDVLSILTENSGSDNIEGIILDPPEEEEVMWSGTAFEKMNNLRILIVRNTRFSSGPKYLPNSIKLLDWEGYPSESLPPGFYPRNVVVLRLPDSGLRLEKKKQLPKLKYLTNIDFENCRFITHVPDVSGVPNLRELNLEACENLIVVHHSVGFLKKLEFLNASECTKLRNFLPRIWLPSLRRLDLHNTSVKSFPDIVGLMGEPLTIMLGSAPIKELPPSVVNLTGLTSVFFINIPSNFFMLPKIAELDIEGNHEVRKSFRKFANSRVVAATGPPNLSRPGYSPLRRLYLRDDCLTDEDLHVILSSFPNLEELLVPQNNFVSLPSCIKDSANLRVLDVRGCVNLEEIPELPLSIQVVLADQCPSLNSEASRMLWSQAFKEVCLLEVVMRQTPIPGWFDHVCEGKVVSFWARRKFPVVAVAFNLTNPLSRNIVHIAVYVNDIRVPLAYRFLAMGDHALLCDLRCQDNAVEWSILDTFLVSEWNYVEVKPQIICLNEKQTCPGSEVSSCGAYVYKQETNMEDIKFTDPLSLK